MRLYSLWLRTYVGNDVKGNHFATPDGEPAIMRLGSPVVTPDGRTDGMLRQPPRRRSNRALLIYLALAFLGGVLASGWVASRFSLFGAQNGTVTAATGALPAAGLVTEASKAELSKAKVAGTATTGGTLPPPSEEKQIALSARVSDLEDRLSRINVQAQAASGNAARAEGLLIAFAARRALDRGSALGYIENQLRLRFGEAQPKAVTTVINAAQAPVTLEQLAAELDDLGPSLATGSDGSALWASIQREWSELFVIRKAGTPSPAPQKRLERAERYLEAGNVAAAIAEVQAMPGGRYATAWLERARRYNEARRALDVIETAAILDPSELRGSDGEAVKQPSPLSPGDIAPVPAT